MYFKTTIISLWLLCGCISIQAQNEPFSVEEQLAQMELEMDSLSIFSLIDSILNYESKLHSEFNVRVGYNSSVLSGGRTLGIQQQSLSPGVSYYHKKGFYADVSGFWNSGFDPKYSLTVLSMGYMRLFGEHFTATSSYERWIYNFGKGEPSASLQNSLNVSAGFNTKHFYGSLDYNYLFGTDHAHRIIGNLSGNLSWKRKWIFDKIRIAPSFSIIYGNNDVANYYYADNRERLQFMSQIINTSSFKTFLEGITLTNTEKAIIERINNSNRLNDRQKRNSKSIVYLRNYEVNDYVVSELESTSNQYGLMNYSFSLPIIFTMNKFNIILSYTYSNPLRLPKEKNDYDPVGYFGASVTYRIPLR